MAGKKRQIGSKRGHRTVRVNITVPTDVAKRMRTKPETNWSSVASEAFRRELDREKYSERRGTDCLM